MIRLLVVEDEPTLAYIIQSGLQDIIGGYEVVTAPNGEEGLKLWKEFKPDVIISDIDMPVMNGFQLVERIREIDGNTIILLASALTSPQDVRQGFNTGANDYIKKPFVPDELDGHIRALLKLQEGGKARNENGCYKLGCYKFDAKYATLSNNETGYMKSLTLREAGILQLLCENKNETVKREAILKRFWNTEDDYFASRSLDVFIAKLRKELSNEPKVEIKTIRGVGLILMVND